MKAWLILIFIAGTYCCGAQSFIPGAFLGSSYYRSLPSRDLKNDSLHLKKWSFTKYSALATTFSFFKGGSASSVSVPMGFQLNRRINNNFFAFGGVAIAPAYINFRSSFLHEQLAKSGQYNGMFRSNALGLNSRAELGLMYVNDERTFSISGSIGVGRSSYSFPLYTSTPNYRLNQTMPVLK